MYRKMKAMVFALICTAALTLSAGMAKASVDPRQASSSRSAMPLSDLKLYSNDDYITTFGKSRARQTGVPLAVKSSAVRPPDPPPDPWYRVLWTSIDPQGRDIPTRMGAPDFGWLHAFTKHNMCGQRAISTAYEGAPDKWTSPTRAEYYGIVSTADGTVVMKTTSIAEFNPAGPIDPTPDGRPLGTLTAYCQGMTRCPDWINVL